MHLPSDADEPDYDRRRGRGGRGCILHSVAARPRHPRYGGAAGHGTRTARSLRAAPLRRSVAHRRLASAALRPDDDGAGHRRRRCSSPSALQKGQRVLEIGTGSGYVTALLAQLGAEVVSVERFDTLAESAPASQDRRGREGAHRDRRRARARVRASASTASSSTEPGRDIPATLLSLLGPGGRVVGALVDARACRDRSRGRLEAASIGRRSAPIFACPPFGRGRHDALNGVVKKIRIMLRTKAARQRCLT